jgi:hypothetical protein
VSRIVRQGASGGKSIVHGGYDHHAAADADQSGEQARAKSGQHPQSDQLDGSHRTARPATAIAVSNAADTSSDAT